VSDAHAAETVVATVAELLHHRDVVLTPQMTVKEAASQFEGAEADALAVVDGVESMRVMGLLTEQYTLRRYAEELEKRRRDISGE
jgi:CIC family chloride channel protein